MKTINKWLMVATGAVMLSSCADELDTNNYVVSRPGQDAQYDYLKDYKPLKEYKTNPNLKVSAALTASEFNEKGMLYALALSNFDEVVAGNAMKMASCVDDKGNMSFDNVSAFVNAASDGGVTVYGHTLLWHSQQPVKYLSKVIAPKPIPVVPGGEKEVEDYTLDCSTLTGLSWNGCPASVTINYNTEGGVNFQNSEVVDPWYSFQFWLVNGINLSTENSYKIKAVIKADGEQDLALNFKLGDWGGGAEKVINIEANQGFVEKEFTVTPTMESNGIFLQLGSNSTWTGSFVVKSFTISHMEATGGTITKEDYALDCSTLTNLSWSGCPASVTINYNTDGGINFQNSEVVDPWYSFQYWLVNGISLSTEKTYNVKAVIKAEGEQDLALNFKLGDWGGGAEKVITIEANQGFVEKEFAVTPTMESNGIFLQLASNSTWTGSYTIKSFTISHEEEAGGATYWESVIENGDMEGSETKNFATKSDQGDIVYELFPGVGVGGSTGAKITSNGGYGDAWESQFWIVSNVVLEEGTKCHVKFDYRADGGCAGTNVDTQAHFGPGEYQHYQCAGTLTFTEDWQTYEKSFTVDASMASTKGMKSIAFNMSPNTSAGAYYIDNVVFEIEKESTDGIPQTPAEKKANLTNVLSRWMSGIMTATQGKVVAWDLINEPISGGGNVGDGYYDLQHFEGFQQGTWDVGGEYFFWQDYLGAEDYGAVASKVAREAFAAVEGTNPSDLKLFINDYNLESTWDEDCKKMRSLLYWIGVWEKNGAQIDGIGTQMHISYYLDEASQNKQKACITRMFELMASSGKLCRISELDMGIYDKQFGNKVENITFEQEKAMGEYYKWIVSEYQRIIPADKQYGICQWCITDADPSSGWRAGEPVGLWTQNYDRKPAYGGFADGLAGK